MYVYIAWLYFGCVGDVFGQISTGLQELAPDLPTDYCRLPKQPPSGSFFSVFCYDEDTSSNECLNVPDTPVRPNWTLTFICDQGFYFPLGQGYFDSRCLGGQWVPPPPPCRDRICSPPSDPPNGRFTTHPLDCVGDCSPPQSHLRDNSLLSLRCVAGYQPPLDCNALCIGGRWLLPGDCQRISSVKAKNQSQSLLIPSENNSCILPEPPEHGTYFSPACYGADSPLPECQNIPATPARDSWTLTFLCDDGYLPTNNHTYYHSKCVHGQWQPALPTCAVSLENGCTLPRHPAHGQFTVSCLQPPCSAEPGTLVPRTYKLTLSCNEGYRLTEGYALSTCMEGSWSPPPPTCGDNADDMLEHRDISEIQSKFASCVLPEPPRHGSYALFSQSCYGAQLTQPQCRKNPGQKVPHLQVLSISCDPGYQLSGQTGSTFLASCDDGQWSQAFPECYKPCPVFKSLTVDIECYQGPKPVPCDSPMLPGTTVTSKCKLNHATVDDPRDLLCKVSGEWSGRLPDCKPNCGRSKLNNYVITPTIVDGEDSPLGYFPWHAGIYHKKMGRWEAMCGGTLIKPHIILTAAHCVTEQSTKKKPQDVRVALGNYRQDWYANETNTVKREVRDIQILPNYLGQESFLDLDIALIALDYPVAVNSFVMPACVDYYQAYPLVLHMIGYLAGWGKTQECSAGQACGGGSDTLLYTNTSFLSFRECYETMQRIKKLPFARITTDKFCAGNGSQSIAQKGDSGGGITFVFGGIHYVKGVISAKISYPDSYSFSAFTNVTHHITWIYKMASYFDTLTD